MAVPQAPFPIRADLVSAQADVVRRWASCATHWSSAERLAIVEEVRRARDAPATPAWVAPSTIEGNVGPDHALPRAAIDAIWRLTNHPGTLTHNWYTSITDAGLDPHRYVELVGVVAQANSIDRFADGLGIARPTLPEVDPSASAPASTVEGLQVRNHWVPTVDESKPNVMLALSAVPAENEARAILSEAQYVPADALAGDLVSGHNALSRIQIELIAARTSKLNECFY